MKRSPLSPKRLLGLIVAMLVVTSFLPGTTVSTIAYIPRSVVTWVLAPPQVLFRRVAIMARPGKANPPRMARGDGEDERRLREAKLYTEQLEQRVVKLRQQMQRLTQSRDLLDLGGVRMELARVSATNDSKTNPLLSIDKGASSGIRQNLAVVLGTGLVGEVVSATPNSAEVRLITAADTKLQVRISPPRTGPEQYTRETQITWDADHGWFYTDEDVDLPIHEGDVVQLADERWQFSARGFFVGTVTEIRRHPEDPLSFHRIVIKPALPLGSLTTVTVLVPVEEPR